MAEAKTQVTTASVEKFLAAQPEPRRSECRVVADMMRRATKEDARMWGSAIVGFGTQTYAYASGRTGDWPVLAFSPRKAALVLYLMLGAGKHTDLLAKLGKHKMGKGCLYLNKLADVDTKVLQALIMASAADRKPLAPASKAAKRRLDANAASEKPAARTGTKKRAAVRPAKAVTRKKAARKKAATRAGERGR